MSIVREITSTRLALEHLGDGDALVKLTIDLEDAINDYGARGSGVRVEFHVPFAQSETRDALEQKCMGFAAQLFERLARESQASLLSSYKDTFTRSDSIELSDAQLEMIAAIEIPK